MSKEVQVTTVDEGGKSGQWQRTEHGTLCVVNVPPGPLHVAVWLHKPHEQPTGLPYAMHLDDGQLMMQFPPEHPKGDPLILPMSEVVKIVRAAWDFGSNTVTGEHTIRQV